MDAHFFIVLVVAIVVGAICKYREINPALPLIVAGFLADFFVPKISEELLDPDLILTLVLAPLVFAAALASSAVDLRRVRRSVLLLAVVLVVLTTIIVGGVTALFIPVMSIAGACALGAMLAPTDAVAASIVAKKSGLPHRVVLLVEGESLANDGTALTILRVAVAAAIAGTVTLLEASKILVLAVGVGVAVGCLGGLAVSWLMKVAREPVVANSILLLAPFALYELSEKTGGSGLLTVVIAGVWIAHATGTGPAYQSRLQAQSVWSLITFMLESLAFVLVGVEFVDVASAIEYDAQWQVALFAVGLTLLILFIRVLFMAGWFALGPRLAPTKFPDRRRTAKEFVAIGLLGVRGPVSVLAAFSLPSDFPERNLILILTFGVVILSLMLSMVSEPAIRALKLNRETEEEALVQARIATAKAALRQLDEDVLESELDGAAIPEKIVNRMRSMAVRRLDSLQGHPERSQAAADSTRIQRNLQRSMLHAERRELSRLQSDRRASGDIIKQLTHELDVREAALGQPGRA